MDTLVEVKTPTSKTDREGVTRQTFNVVAKLRGTLIPISNTRMQEDFGFTVDVKAVFVYENQNENPYLKIGNMVNDYKIVDDIYYPGNATIVGLKGVR